MISTKELRQKNSKELTDFLQERRVVLSDLASKAALKQLKGVRDVRKVKKEIAKCLTIIRERELLK